MPPRSRVNWKIAISVAIVAAIALFFYIGTAPIIPFAWHPEPDPVNNGPYVPNDDLLAGYERIAVQPDSGGRVDECAIGPKGPEDVALGPDGFLYAGLEGRAAEGEADYLRDGIIVRLRPEGGDVEEVAKTGGRPLGVEFDGYGNLYVCDAVTGLWRITPSGEMTRLDVKVDGKTVDYTDNLHVDSAGHVWFSSPSTRWGIEDIRADGMETRPTGRLIRYDPKSGETEVMMDKLMFANGVAMPPDERYVLVAEWYGYRISRLWLKGEMKGRRDVFYGNLPGYPDNLFFDEQGTVWVGLVIPRNFVVDALHPHPFLMRALYRVPRSLQPEAPFYGWLIGLDEDGRLVHNLQDSTYRIAEDSDQACARRDERVGRVTGAKIFDGKLYITSDYMKKLVTIPLPPPPRAPRLDRAWPFPRQPKPPCGPEYEHCKPERFAG